MKSATIELKNCPGECPHYIDEDINVDCGCLYTPPRCRLAARDILPEDRTLPFPSWCPLEDK